MKKMKDPGFHVIAQEHLWLLHKCRSEAMFDAIAEKVLEFWTASNEVDLAQWLKDVYLHEDFKHWFVTATGAHLSIPIDSMLICCLVGVPGQPPDNQSVESAHHAWKGDNFGFGHAKKISLGNFMLHAIPKQLQWAIERTKCPMTLLAEDVQGPPLPMIEAAQKLLLKVDRLSNYIFITTSDRGDGKQFKGYVFNGTRHTYNVRKEYAMTDARAKKYLKSLIGRLPTGINLDAAIEITHSMHVVEIIDVLIDNELTNRYICDCRSFSQSAECSHSLAALTLANKFDLEAASGRVIRGRVRGREKANVKPLGYEAHEFQPERLTRVQLNNQIRRRVAFDDFDRAGNLLRTYVGEVRGNVLILIFISHDIYFS